MTPTKTCTGCGETLPLTDYSPNGNHTDGRQSACRKCYAARLRKARAEGDYDKAQRDAYRRALGLLRNNHRAEFQRLYGQALKDQKALTATDPADPRSAA